jgi:hypothetical protein
MKFRLASFRIGHARCRELMLAGYCVLTSGLVLQAQQPAGLAASALADSSFQWVRQDIPDFRVYFVPDSYARTHRDSLLERLPGALAHARELIDAPPLEGPIDLFFIENRAEMAELIGASATGFAEASTRTVLLVTNPEWRAFERHEIMHVVAGQTWGSPAPGSAWLQEGLAQAADGRCAGYSNVDVMLALTRRHGWIPLDVMLTRFRAQPDLRAYLQAAAFVDYLLRRFGPEPLRELWGSSASPESLVDGKSLAALEREWRAQSKPRRDVEPSDLEIIETRGCG